MAQMGGDHTATQGGYTSSLHPDRGRAARQYASAYAPMPGASAHRNVNVMSSNAAAREQEARNTVWRDARAWEEVQRASHRQRQQQQQRHAAGVYSVTQQHQHLNRHVSSSPPEAISWIVNAVKDMPQKWLGWDETADNLHGTWTKASSSSQWGFSTPLASPEPAPHRSPGRTESEAETVSSGGSRRVSPCGPSLAIQSPEQYFQQQTLMPKAPSRTRSSLDQGSPPGMASSLYSTNYATSMSSYPQSRSPLSGPPSRRAVRAESVECEECKSKDSLVGGSCQICGHESLLHSLTARRAPSLHSYSYSYSGRSQSSYSSVRSSPAVEQCPDCKSQGSIHMGACQVCGFSFDARQNQERKAQWVPYAEIKEQQDPLNFAFSQLKIRGANGQTRDVVLPLLQTPESKRDVSGSPDDNVGKWL